MLRRARTFASITSALCLFAATDAAPATQRTFVASAGNDANPCSLTLPCRGFAAAVTQTLSGGEVIVLDSAGYGPVTITKSISIVAPAGVYAGISVLTAGTHGVDIDTPGLVVTLRGVTINGLGGDNGIRFHNGARLTVENCIVTGMAINGLLADAAGAQLIVRDSRFRDNSGAGVAVTGDVLAEFERVQADSNGGAGFNFADGAHASLKSVSGERNFFYGIEGSAVATTTTEIQVDDSQFLGGQSGVFGSSTGGIVLMTVSRIIVMRSNNGAVFALVSSGAGPVQIVVKDSALFRNAGGGVGAIGTGATVVVDGIVTAENLGYGLQYFSGGSVLSRQNNTTYGNSLGDLAPTPLSGI